MLHHTRAVARGVKRALIVADMPIHSYDTAEQSVETARLFMRAGAQAVKLEGGVSHVAQIEAIVSAGIPFMAHIGMLPQSVREEGGYKVKGSHAGTGRGVVGGRARGRSGRCVLGGAGNCCAGNGEDDFTSDPIPTIGIGSGKGCDGADSGDARFDRVVSRGSRRNLSPPRRRWRRRFGRRQGLLLHAPEEVDKALALPVR